MNDTQSPEQRFEALLSNRDTLQWTGQPRQGVFFRPIDGYAILGAVFWVAIKVMWQMFVEHRSDHEFNADPWPLFLVGLQVAINRLLLEPYIRKNTWYGLTQDAAFFVRGGLRPKADRVYLPAIAQVDLVPDADGYATIKFLRSLGARSETEASFEHIWNASGVYQRCLAAQATQERTTQRAYT